MSFVFVASLAAASPSFAACQQSTGDGFVLKSDRALQVGKGLEWKRCALGMEWSDQQTTCVGEPLALGLEQAKQQASKLGSGWRLPTAEEFDGIFMDSCSGPKIDAIAFPGIGAVAFEDGAEFWTTTSIGLPDMYYYFNVTDGYVDGHSSGFSLFSLLVRNQ
nr:DUF1566 domain-containing protein [uncultured Cohaesibacter sp.]